MKFKELYDKIMKGYDPLQNEYNSQLSYLKGIVNNNSYSDEFKAKAREEVVSNLKSKRDNTLDSVIENIESLILEEISKAEQEPRYPSTEHAILAELKKNNRLVLAIQQVKNATIDELEMMFDTDPTDKDVVAVVKGQLKTLNTNDSKQVLNKIAEYEADTPVRYLKAKLGEVRVQRAQTNNTFYFRDGVQKNIDVDFGINASKRAEFFK